MTVLQVLIVSFDIFTVPFEEVGIKVGALGGFTMVQDGVLWAL